MKLTERIKNVGNYALGTLKNPITYSVLLSSLYGCGEFKKESRDTYCDSTKSELFKGNPQDSIRTFKKFHSPTIDTIWTNQYNWSIRRIEYESSGRRTETIDDMRDWRDGKESSKVDIFKLSQLYKDKKMKTGTWGVKGDVKHKKVELELVLTTQKDILRAVPPTTPNKKSILLNILPGKIDKRSMVPKLAIELKKSFNQEAILSALPPGGVKILRERKWI